MRRFWNSRAVRVLSLVLILSLCLLLHLEYRVENLLREAEEAKLSVENERRERDIIAGKLANSMKHQYTLEKESLQSEEIENEKPQNMEKERTVSFHKTLKSDVSNDETVKLSHQKKSHFKYVSKIRNGVQELWWHLRARLMKMKEKKSLDDIDTLLKDLSHQEKSILVDVQNLQNLDVDWRSSTAKELGELMQGRLHRLQNPDNCHTARKLVCSMGKACGFGCQMHHMMYCFILAYGTGRTLVIQSGGAGFDSDSWAYSREKGWEGAFLPISDTCTTATGAVRWSTDHSTKQVVSVPIIESLNPRPPFLPQAIPKEFADKLFAFHGHPFVWFAGQFLSYLMRPNEELKTFIAEKKKSLGIQKPFVGVQVRRTDKINTEAAFHSIDEYMVHVEEWYHLYGMNHKLDKKRVFIATDDPGVIKEARTKYTEYEFYGDVGVAQSAQTHTRYSLNSLFGVAFDVYMLADSEYLVCTFSSQVCRLGYEIMQTYHVDASAKYYSLDDIYYFGGQQAHEVKALYGQTPAHHGQIDMQVGDVIGIAGNEKDGSSKGKNRRTSAYGEYLSYKVEEIPVIADFPTNQN